MIAKIPRDTLRRAMRHARSKLELILASHIEFSCIPKPEREYRFHPERKWRFDFAWPDLKVAVEVEGLTYGAGGRHQRVGGYQGDLEKYNAAAMAGWLVLRFTGNDVRRGIAIRQITQTLEARMGVTMSVAR
jgi:very-short-patch-repair endonuclease